MQEKKNCYSVFLECVFTLYLFLFYDIIMMMMSQSFQISLDSKLVHSFQHTHRHTHTQFRIFSIHILCIHFCEQSLIREKSKFKWWSKFCWFIGSLDVVLKLLLSYSFPLSLYFRCCSSLCQKLSSFYFV